jgi:hypothetical protein
MWKAIAAAAMMLAAGLIMPSPAHAGGQPPTCGETCGGGGTDYGPGCDGIQETSLTGGMDTFNANIDFGDGVVDVQFSFHVDGGGSWSVTYYYQIADKDGNFIDQGSFTRTYSTADDGSSHEISDATELPAPPEGGKLFLGAYGTSSLGGVSDSRGFVQNVDCWPMF